MFIEDIPKEVTMTLIPQMNPRYNFVRLYETVADDYVQIGDPVSVTFVTKQPGEIRDMVVASLRHQIQTTRAESEMKVQAIEGQIQSLLALSCDKVEAS